MEALKRFEWLRDPTGYRLAWIPVGRKVAYWAQASDHWGEKQIADRSTKMQIVTTQYYGEKRRASPGLYIAGHRCDLNARKKATESVSRWERIRPFETDELISLNLLQTESGPKGWLDFTNRYGLVGHRAPLDSWHLFGRDKRQFLYEVENEGEWHHLKRILFKIYNYHPAITKRDTKFLSKFIQWDSDNSVREDGGIFLGKNKIRMPVAMRGGTDYNSHYFEKLKHGDVVIPAAFALRDSVNRYLERALSVEIDFDLPNVNFSSNLR